MRWKIWFHRSRAAAWIGIGALSFIFGWQNSVVLVWLASVYANIVSDLGASEAADDRQLSGQLDRIEALVTRRGVDGRSARAAVRHRMARVCRGEEARRGRLRPRASARQRPNLLVPRPHRR